MMFFVSFNEIRMAIKKQIKVENWWEELPSEIKLSVERGLKQAESGQTIPHEQMMQRYKKWVKK